MQKHAAVIEEDHELRIREFAGVQHWSCGRTAMSDAACGRGLGGSYWLDQLSRFSVGVYGIRGGRGYLHHFGFRRTRGRQTSQDPVPHRPSRSLCENRYGGAHGRMFGDCRGLSALAGSAGWRNRWNRRRIRWLSRPRRARSNAPRTRFRDRHTRGPDRNPTWLAPGLSILSKLEPASLMLSSRHWRTSKRL
jgi:hypothetical protein